MRDLRKFRNKLTIELDNRQIAFLFTGILAVLAIVFALGVVVGKGLGQIQMQQAETKAASPSPALDMPTPTQLQGSEPVAQTPAEYKEPPVETPVNLLIAPAVTPPPTPAPTAPPGPVAAPTLAPKPTPTPLQAPPPGPVAAPAPTPPPSKSTEPQAPPTPPGGTGWTVQLSAHQNEAEAKEKQQKWLGKGIKAYIVKTDLGGGKGVWYRVRVGLFTSKAGAQDFANAIAAKEGIKPFVTPKN